MKAKYTILLIALGFCFDFAGGWLRIIHSSQAGPVLLTGTLLKIIGVLWLSFKLVSYEGFKKFMNR